MSSSGRRPRLRLLWKLTAPFLALLIAVGALNAFFIVHDLSGRAHSSLDDELTRDSLAVRSYFHDRELDLIESATFGADVQGMSEATRTHDVPKVRRLLLSVLALKPDLDAVAVIDPTNHALVGLGARNTAIDASALAGQGFIDEALHSGIGAKTIGSVNIGAVSMLAIGAPVCSSASPCAPVGAVVIAVSYQRLVDGAAAQFRDTRLRPGLALVAPNGTRLASNGGLIPSKPQLPRGDFGVRTLGRNSGKDVATLAIPYEVRGERAGSIVVALPASPAFAAARGAAVRLSLIILAAIAMLVLIGWLLSRSILAQVRSLVITNRALGSGDLTARAEIRSKDELGELALGVNQMADQLQASVETLELRVEQRTEEIQRLLRERTEFFAGLSHEFRTPLAIILRQAQLLQDRKVRKDTATLSMSGRTMEISGRQLLSMVNEILELARVESGRLEITPEPLDVGNIVREMKPTFDGLTSGRQQKLTVRVPRGLPHISADPKRLREILINLVDNAVKYTPAGGKISVSAAAMNGHVAIEVADTGVGIPRDAADRIFQPFYRVPETETQHGEASTGLGLAITRRLVEAHGGEISFESEPGKGSTFTVRLDAVKAHSDHS